MIFTLCALMIFAVSALHVTPESFVPGNDVELLLEVVQGQETLSGIDVQYRLRGTTVWQNQPMRQDDPASLYWRGIIPRVAVTTSDLEYRFEFKLQTGSFEYLPPDDGVSPLYSLRLNAPKGTLTPGFVLVSDDSTISADDGYVLAVSYLALAQDIDPKSIRVYVGDRDVTKQTEFSGSVLLYREDRPLHGSQKAMITAKVKGADVYSDTWNTQILPGSRKPILPFTYRGAVNLATNIYSVSDKDLAFGNTENDFTTWADLYANYGILDMQTNLLISSLEDSNKQPVNRYSFGIQLPVLDVFYGDYSPSLSQFTLYGKNIRGLYSSFHTNYLTLSWAHGESVRKTTVKADSTLGIRASGTFKQEAIGARVQFGNDTSFRLGFTGSRHRDIISSLDEEYYRYERSPSKADTLDYIYTAMAQDNAVFSVDTQIAIPAQNFVLGAEIAGSLLNRNTIPGPLTTEDLEQYGLDLELNGNQIDPADYAETFVINRNMEPFMPGRPNVAWTGYARLYLLNNLLNFQYTETGSAFNALGTTGQMNDTRVISLTDQINIGRAFFLSGGINITEDNLMGHKSETNIYQSIFAQMIVRPNNLPYLKASFNDNRGENEANKEIENESFEPFQRQAQTMSFGIGYNIVQIPLVPTQLDISYRMGYNDSERKPHPDSLFVKATDNKSGGIAFTMSNRYAMLPLRTQISYSTANNQDQLSTNEYKNSSLFLKADYALWENRIKPYVSFRNTSLSGDNIPQKYNYMNLGVESYPMRDMTVTADIGMKGFKNDSDSSKDYNATTFKLCLTQRF
jgi:hypothetical protein